MTVEDTIRNVDRKCIKKGVRGLACILITCFNMERARVCSRAKVKNMKTTNDYNPSS